ncbi:MAG: hypothetical protein Q8N56_04550 [bacterium]|nr:hypothetical protein [bacterium]
MLWILIAVLSYFLLAITALGDKFLLSGKPEPKNYTFFTNVPGILLILLIPFVGFTMPNSGQMLLVLATAVSAVIASFIFYTALEKFESSRVVPAVGGLLPMFVWLAPVFIFRSNIVFTPVDFIAFLILILGTVLISAEKGKKMDIRGFAFALPAAFLFALMFVFTKQLFLELPFWTVLVLTRVGVGLVALVLLFTKEVRSEICQRNSLLQKKTGLLFLAVQSAGLLAGFLQNIAVALVPLAYLAFINALEGTRYIFLLGMSVFISKKFPGILREKISPSIIIQKAAAIILIIAGLIIFTFSARN